MQIKKHKALTARGIKKFGFTLIEILISLVFIGAGLAFSTKIFVAGKLFLKQSDDKVRAMEIASLKMNEALTSSYNQLLVSTTVDPNTTDFFDWTVNITESTIPGITPTANTIPYKQIEVLCTYNEQDISGAISLKTVRLVNVVPYPTIHLITANGPPGAGPFVNCSLTGLAPCWPTAVTAYDNALEWAANQIISVDILVKVKSDLLVFYNICIDVVNDVGINGGDLILTKCFLRDPAGGLTVKEIQTGTPILSQPSINNVLSISDLAPDPAPYRLEIMWFKDHPAGQVSLKKVNIAVLQVEKYSP